jgi:glucosamine-phosphate N-acetyltransferase
MSKFNYINLIYLLNNNSNYIEQIKNNYLLLLSELSVTPYIETDLFLNNLQKINEKGEIIIAYTGSFENNSFEIIASGTIIIEPKIIRGGKSVGHIEDIVVSQQYRGNGISKKILDMLKTIARENDCYKVILDCNEEVKKVYNSSGFEEKGIQMGIYF